MLSTDQRARHHYSRDPGSPAPAKALMQHPEDSPGYWQRWLEARGVSKSLEQQVNGFYRALRAARERGWAYAYAGAAGGAAVAALLATLLATRTVVQPLSWKSLALVVLAAICAALLLTWVLRRMLRLPGLRSLGARLAGHPLRGEEDFLHPLIESLGAALAESDLRAREEQVEFEQLKSATIMMGLHQASVSELEQQLLERSVGNAFVPMVDGATCIFKLGSPCARCNVRTRTGPLRVLNVPPYRASELGYRRFTALPKRGRPLRLVPARRQELEEFLGKPIASPDPSGLIGPDAELFLCDACGKEATRLGLLKS
jgi:hypothetical protein